MGLPDPPRDHPAPPAIRTPGEPKHGRTATRAAAGPTGHEQPNFIRFAVRYEHIVSDQHLGDFCRTIENAPIVAFDTEFVSEDSFQPELC